MKRSFRLEGLDCAHCAAKIEKGISVLDGVNEVTVNFMTTKLVIEGSDDKMDEIIEKSTKLIDKIDSAVTMKKA